MDISEDHAQVISKPTEPLPKVREERHFVLHVHLSQVHQECHHYANQIADHEVLKHNVHA